MKKIIFLSLLVLFGLASHNAALATGYLTPTITEYDIVGCHKHSQDPRCRQVIKVGCNSICVGHEKETSDFGRACKELCPKLQLYPQKTTDTKVNKPEPRY